jgi:hypothetical protein
MFNFSDKCLHCGKTTKGRSDKKFCDSVCKNRYHYLALKDKNESKPPQKKRKTLEEDKQKDNNKHK